MIDGKHGKNKWTFTAVAYYNSVSNLVALQSLLAVQYKYNIINLKRAL